VKPAERHTDVLIVGGGLVGSALACALADLPLDTVLVEAHEIRPFVQPGFDQRVTALANGSQRILAGLSLWRSLHAQAEAIRSIHICEQGRFGAARIHAEEEGVAALGYTIENQVLGRVLWENLQGRPRFSALAPAQVRSLRASEDGVTAQIQARGEQLIVHAKLLVAADGERSWVRRELGIAVR
jgi:2-octaprenyl-6-methoxyphenol hydroxylase